MGLEVLDRFVVAADGWGSLDDPRLPRGGHPLALLEPGRAGARPRDAARRGRAGAGGAGDRFADHYEAWWSRPEGPGGVLHGVRLGDWAGRARAFGPASLTSCSSCRGSPRWTGTAGGGTSTRWSTSSRGSSSRTTSTTARAPCRALLLALVRAAGAHRPAAVADRMGAGVRPGGLDRGERTGRPGAVAGADDRRDRRRRVPAAGHGPHRGRRSRRCSRSPTYVDTDRTGRRDRRGALLAALGVRCAAARPARSRRGRSSGTTTGTSRRSCCAKVQRGGLPAVGLPEGPDAGRTASTRCSQERRSA